MDVRGIRVFNSNIYSQVDGCERDKSLQLESGVTQDLSYVVDELFTLQHLHNNQSIINSIHQEWLSCQLIYTNK